MELSIEQALEQGVKAHKEGKLQEAERLYRAILQSQPAHPDANHNLGVLAVSVNKADASLPLFKTALEANPKIEQFWLSYIDVLIKVKRFDEAKRCLAEGEKSGVSTEKLDALRQHLKGSLPNDTTKTAIRQTLSEKRKRLAEKKKRKKRNAKVSPSSAAPSQDQINTLLEQYQASRLKEAEALATSLTQQFPKHPFGWKVLGAVFQQTGRLVESLEPMQSAVKLSPRDAAAHSNLGNTQKELGKLDEAETSYTRAIALQPDFAEAHSNLGVTLQELGRLDEAEASYTQAIALKSDFADALYNRSQLLFDKAQYEAALIDAEACIFTKAKVLPLISLYALGRVSEIYERLELQSKSDAENISLAAFATFISEVEKKPTAYNFCPNPIDFINIANLSSHVDDSVTFLGDVIEELNKIETMWEPSGKATISGFQSLTGMN
jgi:tetratricopeptide (TPR) repeat protein